VSAQPVGLVDIGSNSVVLVVARADALGWQVLERVKRSARLGAYIDDSGALSLAGVERLRLALRELIDRARLWNVPLRLTATASLRNVSNGVDLAQQLGSEFGAAIEILSDQQEAGAAFLGVWDAERRPLEPLVVVDVGGGSAEVAWGSQGHMDGWLSIPLGGVRLSSLQAGADPVEPIHVAAMKAVIADQLDDLQVQAPDHRTALACSGSIRRLCALAGRDDQTLSCAELDELVERLARAGSRAERLAMPGMDPDRVDVLLPAALIHQALAHRYRWDSYRLSAGGLRWGLLCGALNAAHSEH